MVDNLDKKIMYELDKNARISYEKIAKNIKSKKDVVFYRFNKLLKKGVIKKFITVFSLTKIGITYYKIHFQFQGLTKEQEEVMLQDFLNDPEVVWVCKSHGRWDLMVGMYALHVKEFAKLKNKIFEKYGKYIHDHAIIINESAELFHRDYLLQKQPKRRESYLYQGEDGQVVLTNTDKELFRLIKNNGRFKITDLAKKLHVSVPTIQAKLKKFKKEGFIQGHTTFFDLNKLNLQYFKLFIFLGERSKKDYRRLLEFCKSQPNVIYILKTIGPWEIELEIEVENIHHIYALTKKLRNEFPNIIKKMESAIISEELNEVSFPNII